VIGTATELAALQRAGRQAFPGFRLTALAATASTQDVVRVAARGGAEPGYSCVAGVQSAGRGRQGRRWTTPSGAALLCSVLVRVHHSRLGGVSIAAGLAARAAIAAASGYSPRLKWPNDVVAGQGKLAGVLCEAEPAAPGAGAAVVIGLGVNLRVDAFPAQVAGTSLHVLVAEPPAPAVLFAAYLGELAERLDALQTAGMAGLRDEWLAHAAGIGETVTAHSAAGSVTGTAEGIDEDGALLIAASGSVVRVLAGDVHIGLPPPLSR
jgi:BirA family transcriptional regulator, biotin operon repressor / biotin---[acetyl-CoA-carboxylase] ligase